MSINSKLNDLISKHGIDEESLMDHLKKKFSKEYKEAIKNMKDEGVDNPEMEINPGRIADHIKKEKKFFEEIEKFSKKNSGGLEGLN